MKQKNIYLFTLFLFLTFRISFASSDSFESLYYKRYLSSLIGVDSISSFQSVLKKYPKIIIWSESNEIDEISQKINIDVLDHGMSFELKKVATLLKFVKKEEVPIYLKDKVKKDPEYSFSEEEKKRLFDTLDFEKLSPTFFKFILKKIDQKIDGINFSDTEMIKTFTSKESGLDFSSVPQKIADFFDLILNKYFNLIPIEQKKSIIKDFILLEEDSSFEDKILVILNNSGPILQKAFQLFANETKSIELKNSLNQLKSHVKPFPYEDAIEIISQSLDQPIEDVFYLLSKKPVASGTVGQVYEAILKKNNKSVMIKVKRPNIENLSKKEVDILNSLSNEQGIIDLISKLEESFLEECDFKKESSNLLDGRVYHGKYNNSIQVVNLIDELPTSNQVIYMEKAKGKSIKKETKDLNLKADALKKLLVLWFEEAMFKSGFFHADLHSGNIFYKEKKRPNFCSMKNDYILSLIDFGNVSRLNRAQVKSILKISLGLSFKCKELVIFGLKQLIFFDEEQILSLDDIVNHLLDQESRDVTDKITVLFNKSLMMGAKIPKEIALFFRGKKFIEDQIIEIKKELEFEKRYRSDLNIDDIYDSIVKKNIGFDIWWTLSEMQGDKESLVDNTVVMSLITNYIDKMFGFFNILYSR